MLRIFISAILCAVSLGLLGCADSAIKADNANHFSSDPYNYEFGKNL